MKRRHLLIGLAAALMLASGGYVLAILRPPDPRVVALERAAGTHKRLNFYGTIVSTSMVSSKPFEMSLDIDHRTSSGTTVRISRCWKPPGRWRGQMRHRGRQGGGPHGQRQGMILPWWRENARTFLQPVIDPLRLADHYSLRELPGKAIAGRETWALELIPAVKTRPFYRIWFDQATDVALGFEAIDPASGTISAWRYETFTLGEAPPREQPSTEFLLIPPESSRTVSLKELKKDPPFDLWVPQRLPRGFAFHTAHVKRWHGYDKVTLAYTDGIAVFSITESAGEAPWKGCMSPPSGGGGGHGKRKGRGGARSAPVRSESAPAGTCGRPIVHRWTKQGTTLLRTTLGETQVHIMGVLPEEELTDVLRSLAPHPKSESMNKE